MYFSKHIVLVCRTSFTSSTILTLCSDTPNHHPIFKRGLFIDCDTPDSMTKVGQVLPAFARSHGMNVASPSPLPTLPLPPPPAYVVVPPKFHSDISMSILLSVELIPICTLWLAVSCGHVGRVT